MIRSGLLLAGAGLAALALAGSGSAQGSATLAAQMDAGRTAYAANCAACHGDDLAGGQFAGTLTGPVFLSTWGELPAGELLEYISTSMPPGGGGRLSDETYQALTALILVENGVDPELTLASATLPEPPTIEEQNALGIGGISTFYPFPEWEEPVDRFADYTPVTADMLDAPAPENWMAWRRGHEGQGFSPLTQITPANVSDLSVAWAQALPVGPTMAEPLVRDGVMYVHAYGEEVFAFDAATGRQLWRYRRQMPEGTLMQGKKTIALWDDMLILATSDLHMLALDARTGRPVWDVAIPDAENTRSNGGPLVADGVVMIGLATQRPGGGLIAAFDAQTGEHLWNFDTVAKSGTLGGDTWNEVPDAERQGGSVWTSGSYDAETGLALWGVAQTYDTGPVRDRVPGGNNDGLFTNSTLAFEPRTGELVWYFQHMPNDQYDLDWVFERVIADIEVGGEERHVVITGGKDGLFDTLDVRTGEYLDTADMGFQTYIVDIDPETGRKTADLALLPGRDRDAVFMCPHAGGGRNWSPTAFAKDSAKLFVNARDTCMEMRPTEQGFLSSGVDIYYSAPPDSDGNFGILQGIDMETGEVAWEHRRRAPYNAGILATGSGLLFTGAMDREFLAYDQSSGEQVWRSGLTGVPNASPITYAVDGKQYVAVVTGMGNPLAFGLPDFTPELPIPEVNSSSVYVFALDE
ncbi:outer membrane protein assembly factor BamB family protein [Aurantiacibacter poecillastricola]|uniref:outer membrane protein assembly factor BamB family protein n=1 Tax=Aurantiacibacter poecillastricola TaxID=3064385 RepID=UPI00273E9413|nr:PQQ-binding-like beta-propeller repeat protein [Aurantiacibacter sp. 219JJ12-13]MDP5262433.1 PQQ-binding-like beta-propeller repeat protein [Aurantiacibacter sp. 219JJ12-13]